MPTYDLLIRAGRVVCPATGFDGPGTVAVRGDRIVAVGPDVAGDGRQTIDDPAAILLPGLIDLHAHPAKSGSRFGVDPDRHQLLRGTTTTLSQGDAGADGFESYLHDTIKSSQTQVLSAINLSVRGEAGPESCFAKLEWADVAACVNAVKKYRSHIWGIAVNTSHHACGSTDPREVFRRGLAATEATGLPLLYGMRRPEDWPLEEQLCQLRPGDVVTYCYRRTPHCIVHEGRMLDAVLHTRGRGVLFDIGHGTNSFDFVTAETALHLGFPPDTISTDLQRDHIGQTQTHDLPLMMSKLHAAGMPELEVFRAVTSRPAEILGLEHEIGTLAVGSRADFVLLHRQEASEPLADSHGNTRPGKHWTAVATIRGGLMIVGEKDRGCHPRL